MTKAVRLTALLAAILCAAAMFTGCSVFQGGTTLLTQNADQAYYIVVRFESGRALEIYDSETIGEIFDILAASTDVKWVPFPSHSQSQQSEPDYQLYIHYRNGGADLLRSTETGRCVYRFSDTRGPDGDEGYVSASNELLPSYLNSLL